MRAPDGRQLYCSTDPEYTTMASRSQHTLRIARRRPAAAGLLPEPPVLPVGRQLTPRRHAGAAAHHRQSRQYKVQWPSASWPAIRNRPLAAACRRCRRPSSCSTSASTATAASTARVHRSRDKAASRWRWPLAAGTPTPSRATCCASATRRKGVLETFLFNKDYQFQLHVGRAAVGAPGSRLGADSVQHRRRAGRLSHLDAVAAVGLGAVARRRTHQQASDPRRRSAGRPRRC